MSEGLVELRGVLDEIRASGGHIMGHANYSVLEAGDHVDIAWDERYGTLRLEGFGDCRIARVAGNLVVAGEVRAEVDEVTGYLWAIHRSEVRAEKVKGKAEGYGEAFLQVATCESRCGSYGQARIEVEQPAREVWRLGADAF